AHRTNRQRLDPAVLGLLLYNRDNSTPQERERRDGYDSANYHPGPEGVARRASPHPHRLPVRTKSAAGPRFFHCWSVLMISIQLPDGSRREYPGPVTVGEVAASIGAGLAKAAIAGRIGRGGESRVVDTSFVLDHDERLAIVTEKDADGLDVIRHSTAHLLAYAVKE